MVSKSLLYSFYVYAFAEFLTERFCCAAYPYLHFAVRVEIAGSLNEEMGDCFVRDRVVFPFLACHALYILYY